MNIIGGFLIGFAEIPRAIRLLLDNRELLKLAVLPLVAAMVTFVLGGAIALGAASVVGALIAPFAAFLVPLATMGTFGTLLVATFLLAPLLVMLVGFPLCEPLSLAVDEQIGGIEHAPTGLAGFLRNAFIGAFLAVLSIIGDYCLGLMVDVDYVGWFYLGFLILMWKPMLLAFDACDAVFAARGMTLLERFRALMKDPFATLGVGLATLFLVSIPLVNLVGLPIAVVLGTLHAHRLDPR